MIVVIDYGAGNLQSVCNVLDAIGAPYRVASDGAAIVGADRLLLPGVGHFGQLAAALDRRTLRTALLRAIEDRVPYLGICLGAQILYEASDEAPGARGLGIIEGRVTPISGADRLPHMGWNTVTPTQDTSVVAHTERFYFANTYCCPVSPHTTAVTDYGQRFSAVVEIGTACGVQFHPEKSGSVGIELIRRWAVA